MRTWIILRAAGISAYLMLFLSVAWGLVATTSVVGKKVSKASAVAVHQFTSTVALVLLAVHLAGVLLDRFVPFHPLDIVVPFHATYRPVAVAFGIAAMYLAVVVLVTSWMANASARSGGVGCTS
jgi:methionine sulfoxide reductase heme-binding subunit